MYADAHVHIGHWRYKPFYGLKNGYKSTLAHYRSLNIGAAIITRSDALPNHVLLKTIQSVPRSLFRAWFFPWVERHEDLNFLWRHRPMIHGLKLHPAFSRIPVTHSRFVPFLRFAEEQRLPLLVHTGRWKKVSGFQHLLKVANRWPNLTFIAGHAGGASTTLKMEMINAINKRCIKNIYLEMSGCFEYWILEHGLKTLPSHLFLFGSDYPTVDPSVAMKVIQESSIMPQHKVDILGRNLGRFMAAYYQPSSSPVR